MFQISLPGFSSCFGTDFWWALRFFLFCESATGSCSSPKRIGRLVTLLPDAMAVEARERGEFKSGLAFGQTVLGLYPCPDPTDRSRYQNLLRPIPGFKRSGHSQVQSDPDAF